MSSKYFWLKTKFLAVVLQYILLNSTAQATEQKAASESKWQQLFDASTYTTGVEYVHNLQTDTPLNAILSFGQKTQGDAQIAQKIFQYKIDYNLWIDREQEKTLRGLRSDNIENFRANVATDIMDARLTVGWQDVTWGENLLMPILDVVNQRRITHPRGFYDPAAKVSSFMSVIEQDFGSKNLQLIYNPIPNSIQNPDEVNDFKVKRTTTQHTKYDEAEFGGRFGLNLGELDTKVYAFHHWPRVPSFRFIPFSGDADIEPFDTMSNTYGWSASYAEFAWLLRADLAYHTDYPAININSKIETSAVTQGIVGLTITSLEQQTLGAELHMEHWDHGPVAYNKSPIVSDTSNAANFYWVGLIANLTFFNNLFQPNIIYFKGISMNNLANTDQLIRLIGVFHLSNELSTVLELQKTHSETSSPKLLLSQRQSLSWRLVYAF